MSDSLRQTNLLFGEDWKKIYRAISQVNYAAGDYDTFREAFVEYLRTTYPEDFNDWVESSEFVFLMDLLAYLGQNFAFKFDLNVRESFFLPSERRESVLKHAASLSYSPSRNLPARGLAKIVEIETDEDVDDINGNSLRNVAIRWNDETDEDWFDKFITVMNSSMISTNPFGTPVKAGSVSGIQSQLYRTTSVAFSDVVRPFTSRVSGQTMNFEVVNPDFVNNGIYMEREPNPEDAFHLLYRNDGGGNASVNTGFFVYFKQGTLAFRDYLFNIPVENREQRVNINNINQQDVWVQEISDQDGSVVNPWTKVATTENIVYNSVGKTNRRIFEVKTEDNDQITIRFADGRFGDSPVGAFRIWYRSSNGLRYRIRPQDIRNISVVIPYTKVVGNDTKEYNLRLQFSLQVPVTNSTPRETVDQIKIRAPQYHKTQARMVSGEDYNVFPLTAGNIVRKIKAINRTYAGHSRYFDINDPTGNFQNTNIFGEDGILYTQDTLGFNEESLPSNRTNREILNARLTPLVSSSDLINFFYAKYPTHPFNSGGERAKWESFTIQNSTSTGRFIDQSLDDPIPLGEDGSGDAVRIRNGVLVKFVNTDSGAFTDEKWVKINSIVGDGTEETDDGFGPVTIKEALIGDWYVDEIFISFTQTINQSAIDNAIEQMNLQNDFALRYDEDDQEWKVINVSDIDYDSSFSLDNAGDTSQSNLDASWIILAEYDQTSWQFRIRYVEFIFESVNDSRFFFEGSDQITDISNGQSVSDYIRLLRVNTTPDGADKTGIDYFWDLSSNITYSDGFIEPRRIKVTMRDTDRDGTPDDPTIFSVFVDPPTNPTPEDHKFVFWEERVSGDGYDFSVPVIDIDIVQDMEELVDNYPYTGLAVYVIDEDQFFVADDEPDEIFDTIAELEGSSPAEGDTAFVKENNNFYVFQDGEWIITPEFEATTFFARVGRNDLLFQWKHFATRRSLIDPAVSNIHDIYVLTDEYWQEVQRWVNSNVRGEFPIPPDSLDLRNTFGDLERAKTLSDHIVWHSAKFKLLFGEGAIDSLRANFKVVKTKGTTISNNEIRQRVVDAINEFFDIDFWEFGEKFSFTELATFIHRKLPGIVNQVVIVPLLETSKFGNLFEIRSESDELFLPTMRVQDIQIIDNVTKTNIRIGD